MRTTILVPITALALSANGCLRHHRSQQPSDLPEARAVATAQDRDCLWEAVQDTLRRGGYRLDRVDREAGIVTTLPETSQHFLEVWRHDVNTRADLWEATLNPIRRWIEVKVTGGNEICVVVHKERLSSLDRQFNSTGAAYQYFGENLPSSTGKEKVTAEDDRWVDRGRDPAMEQYMLDCILERAASYPG
jgi:hypothetical protein